MPCRSGHHEFTFGLCFVGLLLCVLKVLPRHCRHQATPRCALYSVAANIGRENWIAKLMKYKLDPYIPTLIVFDGIGANLPPDVWHRTLWAIRSMWGWRAQVVTSFMSPEYVEAIPGMVCHLFTPFASCALREDG